MVPNSTHSNPTFTFNSCRAYTMANGWTENLTLNQVLSGRGYWLVVTGYPNGYDAYGAHYTELNYTITI